MTIGGWIAFVLFAALILCAGIAGACLIENVLGKIISVAVAILLILGLFFGKTICDELNSLYERKNHDYGDSFHQTFVEEGLAMTRIRLGDKFSRFKTLSRLSANDAGQQRVTDESIRDTLMDLANYAIMTILEMDMEKGAKMLDPNAACMAIERLRSPQ